MEKDPTAQVVDEVHPSLAAGTERRRNADGKMVLVAPAGAGYMGVSPSEETLVDLLDGSHTLDEVVAAGLNASPQVRPLGVLAMLRRLDRAGLLNGMEGQRDRLFGAAHRASNRVVTWLQRIVDIRLQEDPPGLVTLPTALGRLIPAGLWTVFHLVAIGTLVAALAWGASQGRFKELLSVFPRGPRPLELLTALYIMTACVLSVRGFMRGLLMRSRGLTVRRAGMRILWGIPHMDVDDRERRAASRQDRIHLALVGLTSLCAIAGCAGLIALSTGSGIARLVCAVTLLCLVVDLAPYLRTDSRDLVGAITEIPGMRKRCLSYLHRKALAPWRTSTNTSQDWAYSSSVSLWLAHGALTIYLLGDRIVPGALAISGDLIGGRSPLPEGATWLLPIAAIVMGLMLMSLLGLVLGIVVLVLSFAKHLLLGWMKPAAAANKVAEDSHQAAFVEAAPGIPFLSGLSPDELQTLAGKLRHETYAAGGTVIRQGDAGDRFCFIQQGPCVVEIEETSGLVHEAAHLGPGDFFGEVSLLEEVPRTATVRATG
ncbi:MAG: cyclic nucleotide-binding domain-containing protein, partial [Myxococcota bacterium]|nr:cyclic nucleotide-binding domain-containing protein [Myxococcota bacterium]